MLNLQIKSEGEPILDLVTHHWIVRRVSDQHFEAAFTNQEAADKHVQFLGSPFNLENTTHERYEYVDGDIESIASHEDIL